jgi:hypothetical protein
MKSTLLSFLEFSLLESLQSKAEAYALQKMREREGDPSLPIEKVMADQVVGQIFAMTSNNPNYTKPFLKFYFEDGAPLSTPRDNPEAGSLEKLIDIINNKSNLISVLARNIGKSGTQDVLLYFDSLKAEGTPSGFERLFDEIRTIEREKEAKEVFINRLPAVLREEYKKADPEKRNRLINAAVQFKRLDQEFGNPKKPDSFPSTRFFKKIAALKTLGLNEVISTADNMIKSYQNIGRIIEVIEELEPEVGILYNNNDYLAISVRTERSQKKLCSIANWCINRGAFGDYASTGLQINIFNFNVDPSDPMFLTGTTVWHSDQSEAGTVRTSHNIDDTAIVEHSNPRKHLLKLGYPNELVDAVVSKFSDDENIQRAVYSILSKSMPSRGNDLGQAKAILDLIIRKSAEIFLIKDERLNRMIIDIVKKYIPTDVDRKVIIDSFKRKGITSITSFQLLTSLVDSLSQEEATAFIDDTVSILNDFAEAADRGAAKMNKKEILSNKDRLVSGLQNLVKTDSERVS